MNILLPYTGLKMRENGEGGGKGGKGPMIKRMVLFGATGR